VNIGGTMTNVNIIEAGITAFTRDITIGGTTISEEIQKGLSIGFNEAEKLKLGVLFDNYTKADVLPHVVKGLGKVAEEVRKTIELFDKTADHKVTRVYISGGTSLMEGIEKALHDHLGLPVEHMDVLRNITYNDKQFDANYVEMVSAMGAVSIGLAIRMVNDK